MGATLFIDASCPAITVGLRPQDHDAVLWTSARDEAGVALFRAVDKLTGECGLRVQEVDTAVFCEGPGSLLGIRLAAMALRTWTQLPRQRPWCVQGYRSLELVAAGLLAAGERGPFLVIADGRRSTWNVLSVDASGAWAPIRRHAAADPLPEARAVFHPRDFPLWQPLPPGVVAVDYAPSQLPALAANFPLLHPVDAPDAFMTEMPTYREWTPVHPVRPSRT